MIRNKKKELEQYRSQLEQERSSFISHWRELCDYIMPRRGRFYMNDVNKGDRRNQKIIDSTATSALNTLSSGMVSGLTSPARPWFKLTTPDPDLADFETVKQWLHVVEQRMSSVILGSNFYQRVPILYSDMAGFGTGAMLVEEDVDDVINTQVFPIGSYSLAANAKGKPCGFSRAYQMTVQQLIEEFGEVEEDGEIEWEYFSDRVKGLYENGELSTWIDVAHVIRPNPDYKPGKLGKKFKKFQSCYYEIGMGYSEDDGGKYLRESGYDRFPILAPRWKVSAEDTYGTDCPGMTSLGDVKALQLMHKRKAQAIDKQVNPPMIAPTAMQSVKSSILSADITYFDETSDKKFRAAHEVNFRISDLRDDIMEHQHRIKKAFHEDIMLMFAESDRRQITAREVDERSAEKFLILGPVLSNVNKDLLDPFIDIVFNAMEKQGLLPPAPEEIQGVTLKVEYVSVVAQAQKLVGLDGVKEYTRYIMEVAQADPRILRKFNSYEAANVVGDITSVPPKMIVSDEDAQAAEAAQQQQMQAQAEAEQAAQAATAAQKLSQSPIDSGNALGKIMGI
jgi:hypothetical protein